MYIQKPKFNKSPKLETRFEYTQIASLIYKSIKKIAKKLGIPIIKKIIVFQDESGLCQFSKDGIAGTSNVVIQNFLQVLKFENLMFIYKCINIENFKSVLSKCFI
jgi:hypothetical protein